MDTNIGERLAGIEAAFNSFRHEILDDNKYIRDKLDTIADSLSQKVDRTYCQDRHEKLGDKVADLEKDGKHDKLEKRIRALELKAPAIIRDIVLVFSTGTVMAAVSYLISRLP